MLTVGSPAPPFSAPDQMGTTRSLEGLLEKGALVLFFYPRDFTLLCTREVCGFRDSYEVLFAAGVAVAGVSPNDAQSHDGFARQHAVPYPLLADADKAIARRYDVLQPFGLGVKRVTYLITRPGTIVSTFHAELRAGAHVRHITEQLKTIGL